MRFDRYYRRDLDMSVLASAISALSAEVADTPYAQTKINSNLEMLRRFERTFALRNVSVVKRSITSTYSHASVEINVTADLCVVERNVLRFIKFQFANTNDPAEHGKIACQLMYEVLHRIKAPPLSAMRVWNCRTESIYSLGRIRTRTKKDIEASCKTIASIWRSV